MASYFSESDIAKLSDQELRDSLARPNKLAEHKAVVISELTRRSLNKLDKTINKFGDDGARLAGANFLLSIAVFFIGWMGLVV